MTQNMQAADGRAEGQGVAAADGSCRRVCRSTGSGVGGQESWSLKRHAGDPPQQRQQTAMLKCTSSVVPSSLYM